jgi:hypothetical protein
VGYSQPQYVERQAPRLEGWYWYQHTAYGYKNGVQVCGWEPKSKTYREYDAASRTWSEPMKPPWEKKNAQ